MVGQPRRTHETDRRLALPVGLVVVLAVLVLAAAADATVNLPVAGQSWQTTTILTLLVILGMTTAIRIRIRSTTQAIQWCDVAIIIGLAVAPPPIVVICTAVGVTLAYLFRRRALVKSAFNVAKETVLAGAAWILLHTLGWNTQSTRTLRETLVPLIAAFCLLVVLDEVVMLPVIALDTGTRIRQLFRADTGLRLFSAAARLSLIVGTVLILELDNRLLLAIPPLVVSLHLAYAGRLRSREERQAWQRLARTTEALNVVDPDLVLRTAVARAAELFSADEVEVELTRSGRLVRGGTESISYDGPATDAPRTAQVVIPAALTRHDDHEPVGEVRLRFHGPVKLSEREHYTLRTFASALCTAIRNAAAYAELDRVAREQAHAATHDALTGLPNRRHLMDVGNARLQEQHATGVVALLLIAVAGPGTASLIVAIGIATLPHHARVVRGQTLLVRRAGYVEQAVTFGLSRPRLVLRHILPNVVGPVPVLAVIGLGEAILTASGLSFLGLGPQPPSPEWGAMLSEGRNYLQVAWWISLLPGVAVTLTVVSLTVLGRHWQARFDGRQS